ncbi:GNAT family N-acetyltransferase [Nonomuraea africana]|uniref:CelD/BcsL family acetyltransferase involved in cellulose biosynthesis n=1 Tax=Nonomuraea africana TaxID=46171 RepID=A0ABR9KB81_9ACTN|nr:GNAT family N-acetyltransferase [Nonomuraea africana]MBE1558807.1 CelD/BcsL family acetyltransferase involved in cellulose biosynthesis [Nonomuraea africana]
MQQLDRKYQSVSVVRPGELGTSELTAWRGMQAAQPHLANPFLSPEFALAMGEVSAAARVGILSDEEGLAGFFPFEVRTGGMGSAIGAWVSLCQGVIHRPGAAFDAQALLKGLGLHVWEFGCLVERQPWFQPYETLSQQSVVLDLSAGYGAYAEALAKRSPKFYKSTLYKERKLGRDAGEITFDFASRDPGDFRALREWKSAQYRRMGRADRFGKPWVVELAERLHAIDTPSFAGPLSMMYVGGRPVAGHFGLRSDSVLVGWFPAYDPAFAKYSPGLIQHLRMAEAAAGAGLRAMDLGIGTGSEYKEALRSHGAPVAEGVVRRRTLGAAVHRARHEPVRLARRLVLDTPVLYRAADRLLRAYGRRR